VNEGHLHPAVSSILYRQPEPFETAAVSALAREVFDQFVASCYQPEGVTEFHRYSSPEALSQRHDSGHVTFVAEQSGELVGMLHLRKPSHVSMLFVQAAHQRSGVARGLLAAAGDTGCQFTVSSSPNAVAAYERLGFRVTDSEQCVHGIRFIPMQRLSTNDRNA
jgi:GNAT superfamily N-acetyltransferase